MGRSVNGLADGYARMEGYDSTVGAWVASPPFSAGGPGGASSTIVTISTVQGLVTVTPSSTDWASSAGFHFNSSGELLTAGPSAAAGSTQVSVSSLAGKVLVDQNSSVWQVQIHGDSTVFQGSSAWQAQITNQVRVSNSTAADFLASVQPVAGSTWAVRPIQSSAADLQVTATPVAGSTWNVRALQSSAADLQVTATPLAGSTWNVRAIQSSRADLNVTAFNTDNLGNLIESSTRAQGTNSTMRGLAVRSIGPDSTFASGIAAASGNQTVLTSGATQLHVYSVVLGYAGVISTSVKVTALLQSGAGGAELFRATWQMGINASTSGFNLDPYVIAVSPPAYLFRTAAGALLNLNGTSSGVTYCVSAWRE